MICSIPLQELNMIVISMFHCLKKKKDIFRQRTGPLPWPFAFYVDASFSYMEGECETWGSLYLVGICNL